jgi:acetyl-CoA carboxylase biotin carboxyl carrier protein
MRSFLIIAVTILVALLAWVLLLSSVSGKEAPLSWGAYQEDVIVPSPMNGLLALSETPGGPPAVKVGDQVKSGQVLCVVDNMPVRAMVSGTVMQIMVEDGQMVIAMQPLFRIK